MFFAIDIGGTKTKIAASKALPDIQEFKIFDTKNDLSAQVHKVEDYLSRMASHEKIDAIVIGLAGYFDRVKNRFVRSRDYPELNGKKANTFFEKYKDVPVYGANDAQLAALGESVLGAGKKYKRVVYITLSTGVGGALIENKKFSDMVLNFEPGHHIVDKTSEVSDGFNIKGTLESFVSGTSFERQYGMLPSECEDTKIWDDYAQNLGMGLWNIYCFWYPEVIILGGGVTAKFDSFIEKTRLRFNEFKILEAPEITKSFFGDGAGLAGGLVYLQQIFK